MALSEITVPRSDPSTLAEAAIRLLEDHVAPLAPCIPGGYDIPLLEALRGSCIRPVVAKTESGAGFIADGIAWETRRTTLGIAITGPGVTNFVTPLACAKHERNPILLLSADVPAPAMGRRAVQDGSDLGPVAVSQLTGHVTALSVAADGPVKALHALAHAVRVARARRMPVHVDIALDALTSTDFPAIRPFFAMTPGSPIDVGALQVAADMLGRASRPALLVGRGGRWLGRELVCLAERLGAPVLTTPSAKGVFPESHRLSAGVYSFAHRARAGAVVDGCDLLLVLGSALGEFASRAWNDRLVEKVLVHVTDDPADFGRTYAPSVPVLGDAQAAVEGLLAALDQGGASSRVMSTRAAERWFERLPRTDPPSPPGAIAPGRVDPSAAFQVIQRHLPRDARVVVDIGSSAALAAHDLVIDPPQRCYLPIGYACVGHAIAAAVGVRAASGAPTVVLAGDAAFLANTELHTAVEQRLGGLTYVILNNGGNWMVESGVRQQFGRDHSIETGMFRVPPNVAGMASAMGARAYLARSIAELDRAMRLAVESPEPAVIDLHVALVPPPMADRVDYLKRARMRSGTYR